MTVLVLSDIHANLEALEAVLAHAAPFDRVWFLGDAVGYGPDPNACVERLAALAPEVWLAGNHDWAALGRLDLSTFNPDPRLAAEWTAAQLTPSVRERLAAAEPRLDRPARDLTFVHASPRHPLWEYILDAGTARENFAHFDTGLCLFGHTHVPVVYEEAVDGVLRRPCELDRPMTSDELRWLVNPGSVGQPRDGDPRASYLTISNGGALTFQRVAYEIPAVQAKILAAGLPPRLAARLEVGW
jgi:predicted phosphodiesterase